MKTQKRLNMNIGNYTKTLRDDLRKALLITLTLLFVCPGVWGQVSYSGTGAGTEIDPYIVTNVNQLDWVFANGGYAQLNQNITKQNTQFVVTANPVHLDLAGHTLTVNHGTNYFSRIIEVTSTGSLTITDSSGNNSGQITGGNLYPGCGAGIYNSGILIFEGGTITGNNAQLENSTQGYGGAIYNAANASLTISGGVITNNHAHNAGGIYNDGNITLTGGSITNNNNNTSNSLSAGIYNTTNASLTISGKPIVENNGYGDIFLQNGMKITIDGELTGEEGRICIKMANYNQGAFTTGLKEGVGYSNPEGYKYFKSDNTSYEPYFDETETTEASFYTNWVALGKRFAAGGTIKLNKDYVALGTDTYLEVPADKEVILDLNGKDINRNRTSATTDGCVFKNLGQLTIKDTGGAGLGTIRGGYNSGDGGGIVNNGILNIEGCEIYNNRATGNGGGIYHNGTSLNMKGNIRIHGNTGNYIEGNVYLTSGKIIIINGQLDVNTQIGVTMADYRRANTNSGVFTSGLNTYGSISNFTSDKATQYAQYINVYSDNGEAKLQTDWSHLQDEMQVNNNVITLGKDYQYGTSDAGGLSVPGSTTVTLNLNGHTIDRNLSSTITDGYVIKVESGGTLTISGTGTITGGRNIGDGGGIVNNGTLTIQGGTITGNRATGNGGGIYHNGTSLTLSGAPVITGNTSNSLDNNVYLPNGKLITIGAGSLTGADRSIGVSMETPGTFTSGLASSTLHVKFSSDDANYDTAADNSNQAQLLSAWQALKKRLSAGESNIILYKNYTAAPEDNSLSVPSGKTITLDLNGHYINRNLSTATNEGYVIKVYTNGTLTITDSGINGTITGGNNSSNTGGGIYNEGTLTIIGGSITGNTCSFAIDGGGGICNRGTLTISGGTISNNYATYNGGGIFNSSFGSTPCSLTINGGTIENNTATNGGGGIYNGSSSSGITISGGTIKNNSANNGGGIYLGSGTLSISGGTIQDNTATSHGGGVYFDSGTFNLSGNPTVVGNTVSGEANNIYLPNGKKITVNGSLTGTNGTIGITMANPTIFTSGLTTNSPAFSSYEKFSSDASTTIKVLMFGDEAQLKSYWYYLQDLFNNASTDADHPTTIVLESGKVYKPLSNESAFALSVPSYTYITLNLNGQTIDRGLGSSAAQGDGCVIDNQGNLRITGSGIITGGNNNDTGTAKGGGIYNTGTLILEGASSIQNNQSTLGGGFYNAGTLYINGGTVQENSTSLDGGGIYQASGTLYINGGTIQSNTAAIGRNGAGIFYDGGTFNLAGNPNISSNTVNSVANNVYLKGNNNITITNILSNTTAIGIVCENGHTDRAFTSGLSGKGNAEKFTSNVAGREIGVNSLGEAIIGIPYTLSFVKYDASIYVNGNKYDESTLSVVAGGHLKVQVQAPSGYIPISFKYTGDIALSANDYPKSNVEYPFNMPGHDVTITAVCKRGGYCGNSNNEDVKFYLDGTTLKFVGKDGSDYQMNSSYTSVNSVPWYNMSAIRNEYTSVEIATNVTSISPYAFFGSNLATIDLPSTVTSIGTFAFGNCTSLTAINVNAGNANFMNNSSDGVLYTKSAGGDPTNLICYPAGKANTSQYELPASVTEIADGAFAFNTHLESITVAGGSSFSATNGVLYNAGGTVLYCYPAKKEGDVYDVASTVMEIKPYAFHNNNLLKVVNFCEASVPTGGTAMFDLTDFKIMVKKGLKVGNDASHYQGATNWSNYYSRIYEMDLANAIINLEYDNYVYETFDNPVVKPGVTSVKLTTGNYTQTLRSGIDYEAIGDGSYSNNNVVGTATVTITGAGGYDGTSSTKIFTIKRQLIISGASDYYSYYAKENLFAPEGIGTVYTVSGVNWSTGVVTVTNSGLGYLPENVPVLIYKHTFVSGTMNGTYQLTAHAAGTPPTPCEYFKAETEDKTLDGLKALRSASEIYVLRGNNFVRATSGTLKARHCYLWKPIGGGGAGAPAQLSISFDDNTTNIDLQADSTNDSITNSNWYTLDGRKLEGKPAKKGVYIKNGKKVVVK